MLLQLDVIQNRIKYLYWDKIWCTKSPYLNYHLQNQSNSHPFIPDFYRLKQKSPKSRCNNTLSNSLIFHEFLIPINFQSNYVLTMYCYFFSIHSRIAETNANFPDIKVLERNDSMASPGGQRSRGLSPRPRVLSHASRFPFTLIFAWLRDLGKISRIGWKRWLSSSYRGICSTYFILKPDCLVSDIYKSRIGKSGRLFQGNFFLKRRRRIFVHSRWKGSMLA